MAKKYLGSCGWSLGARTELMMQGDGRVVLTCPMLGDQSLDEPLGRALDHHRVIITSPSVSTRTIAYRATLPVKKGWSRNNDRVFAYEGERRTDPETGRECPVWRLR